MNNRQILKLATSLAVGSIIVVIGCSKTPPNSPMLTATSTPAKILETSAKKMAALESLSFKLTHESGGTPLMDGVLIKNIIGKVILNEAFDLQIDAEALGITALKLEYLATDGRVYMTEPISRKWREISFQDTPFDFTNLGDTLAQILRDINLPKQNVDQAPKDGSHLQLGGTIASVNLQNLIPSAADDLEVNLEIVIRRDDFVLTEVRILGPVASTDPKEIVRLLRFYNFNEPMEITAPSSE